MPEMQDNLTYRPFQDSDLPGVLRLWEENTEWGTLTAETFHEWYLGSPYGHSLMSVAIDTEGKIAGQLFLRASRLTVGDQELRALRMMAPILRKDVSRASIRTLNHPVWQLYLAVVSEAERQGYSIMYGLPLPSWTPVIRTWFHAAGLAHAIAQFDCYSRLVETIPSAELYARPQHFPNAEFDDLWQSAKQTYPISCGVVRSAEWLAYDYDKAQTVLLEVRTRHHDWLIGYAAIRKRDGLIMDLLARDPSKSTAVLATAIDWVASQRKDAPNIWPSRVSAMQIGAVDSAFRALSFNPVDYRFTFFYLEIGELRVALPPLSEWYLTPGD